MNAILASWRDRLSDREVGAGGLGKAARRCIPPVLFIGLPIIAIVGFVISLTSGHHTVTTFWDFHVFRNAGTDVLHGRSPYPPANSSVLAHEKSFVYPAPAAVAMVPFALVPFTLSVWVFSLLTIAAIPVSLRLVDVRDYRCYGIALISAPFISSLGLGAISPLLLLGTALLWRYRDRAWIAAASVAALVMLKLFLWPFVLWLAFTRRVRTALLAVGLMAGVTLGSWAVLGFAGLRSYSHVIDLLTKLVEGKGYSLVALGLSFGVSERVARGLPWVAGAVLVGLIAFRGRRRGADAWSFIVATAAAFALSPIVWLHYFVLLFVPIGIVRPRLSWLWALPLTLWLCRGQSVNGWAWSNIHPYSDLALTPRVGDPALILCALAIVTVAIFLAARIASREAGI